jgi:multicomponent Na+:H+ antiporter subunit B
MSRRTREVLVLAAGAGLVLLLLWGVAGLPHFGGYHRAYGRYIAAHGVHQRHATNVVNTIVFDYRGFDTVGEEFILFAAVIGVTLLLRQQRSESEAAPHDWAEGRRPPETSDAVRVTGLGLLAPATVVGIYVVVHGNLTPGGGFQGGAALVAAPLAVYLAGRYLLLRSVHPMSALDLSEGTGAGGFVVVGLVGLMAGAAYLANVVPKGRVGSLFSGGALPILNVLVGLEVAAGLTLVLYEFLEQTLMIRGRS